jgi:hypothetical protein
VKSDSASQSGKEGCLSGAVHQPHLARPHYMQPILGRYIEAALS